ncbi:MAG: SpaA isopeptide-forming pilin-related protein, partial [Lachnospiraceae bacterium]|nr:SpaA isopeptide-forming pilin-related protein [Lachnospiraceae bacterium]
MKHRVKSAASIVLAAAMLATSVFSGGGAAFAESEDLVQMETAVEENGVATGSALAPEIAVTDDGISVSDVPDSIDIETVEAQTGAAVSIQEEEISVDNSRLLSVSAFNKSDADRKFRLYFWDGELPEEKENWNFSNPNMDVFLVSESEKLTGELTVHGIVQDVELHFVEDRTGDDVKARYVLADLPADSSLSFAVRVDADTACDVSAITSVDDVLFEGVALSWAAQDIVIEAETESEMILIEPETNDIVMEESIVIEGGETETETDPADESGISVEGETDVIESEDSVEMESDAVTSETETSVEEKAGTEAAVHGDQNIEVEDVGNGDQEAETESDASEVWDAAAEDTVDEPEQDDTEITSETDGTEEKEPAIDDTETEINEAVSDGESEFEEETEAVAEAETEAETGIETEAETEEAEAGLYELTASDGYIDVSVHMADGSAFPEGTTLTLYDKSGLAEMLDLTEDEVMEWFSDMWANTGTVVPYYAFIADQDGDYESFESVSLSYDITVNDEELAAAAAEGTKKVKIGMNDLVTFRTAAVYGLGTDGKQLLSAYEYTGAGLFSIWHGDAGDDESNTGDDEGNVDGDYPFVQAELDYSAPDTGVALFSTTPSSGTLADGDPAKAPSSLTQTSGAAQSHWRKITFKGADGNTYERDAFCLEGIKGNPGEGTYKIGSFSQFSGSSAKQTLLRKALYYLYSTETYTGWNRDVKLSSGETVNLRQYMIDAGCETKANRYVMTHYVLGYIYTDNDATIWNRHPNGNTSLNRKGVQLVENIVNYLKLMPDPKTFGISRTSSTATYDASRGVNVSDSFTFTSFSGNRTRIALGTGVTLVNETQGTSYTGTGTIYGGDTFHFEATTAVTGTITYTLNSLAAVDFSAWKLNAASSSDQDIGVAFFSTDTGTNISVTWPRALGKIQIQKLDANTGSTMPSAGYSMDGAIYTIYNASWAPVQTLTISNGYAVSGDLQSGTYYVKETTPPSYYSIDQNTYTVSVPAGGTITVTSTDTPIPSNVNVRKVSTANGEILGLNSYSLAGAEFGVYTDSNCTNKLTTLTTDAQGVTGTFTLPLPSAFSSASVTYYIREDKAPAGHKQNLNPVPFTVNFPADAGKTIPVEVSDDPEFCEHEFNVIKLDDKGQPVPNAIFKVEYFDAQLADPAKLVKTWYLQSDKDGKVLLDRLHLDPSRRSQSSDFFTWIDANNVTKIVIPVGGYLRLTEVEAPAEYILDDTPMGFLTTKTVELERKCVNTLEPCELRLKKYDTNGTTPLPGVEFKLSFVSESEEYTADARPTYTRLLKVGESTTVKTNSKGEITFSNLDQGTYQITEVSTVSGHTLLKDPIVVTLPIKLSQSEIAAYGNVDTSKGKVDPVTGKTFF